MLPILALLLLLGACVGEASTGSFSDALPTADAAEAEDDAGRIPPRGDSGLRDAGSSDPDSSAPGRNAAMDSSTVDARGVAEELDAGSDDFELVRCGRNVPGFAFSERAAEAGLDYQQGPANTSAFYDAPPGEGVDYSQALQMTGGAAAGDYDADGRVDLFVTRIDAPDVLYRNLGDGSFADVTTSAGIDVDAQTNGAGWVDIDNDRDLDLFVTAVGELRFYLWVNDGSGHFSEQALARGVDATRATSLRGFSVSFGDYDRDGWIDIHTSEWNPGLGANPSAARLFRNLGSAMPGHFEDVTLPSGADLTVDEQVFAFASSFADLDDDGYPDLAVAGDFGHSALLWNMGDGTFVQGTSAAGVGTDENGMGSTLGDYDGDGDLDWFVSSIWWPTEIGSNIGITGNRLYRNEGERLFSDATDAAGVRAGYWGWGASFFDPDNDSDLDLVMTNGVDLGEALIAQFVNDPMRFWRNDCAEMVELSDEVGLGDLGDGKGLVVFDYDGDGDEDLFVVRHGTTPLLLRNDLSAGSNWLRLSLRGSESNSLGIGARVALTVREGDSPIIRELHSGSNFLGQNEVVLHFGLAGDTETVSRIEITWPTPGPERVVQTLYNAATRQAIEILEPEP